MPAYPKLVRHVPPPFAVAPPSSAYQSNLKNSSRHFLTSSLNSIGTLRKVEPLRRAVERGALILDMQAYRILEAGRCPPTAKCKSTLPEVSAGRRPARLVLSLLRSWTAHFR